MKRGKKIIIISISVIALCVIMLFVMLSVLLSSDKFLTDCVNKYVPKYVNADFHTKGAKFSIFKSFPDISIELDTTVLVSDFNERYKGRIDSLSLPGETMSYLNSSDTLFQFNKGFCILNINSLLSGVVDVKNCVVNGLNANVVFGKDFSNIDFLTENNSDDRADDDSSGTDLGFLKIKYLKIADTANIVYINLPDTNSLFLSFANSEISRDDAKNDYGNPYDIALSGKIKYCSGGLKLPYIPIAAKGVMDLSFDNILKYKFHNFRLRSNELITDLDGGVEVCADSIMLSKFNIHVDNYKLSTLFSRLRDNIFPAARFMHTDAVISLDIKTDGAYLIGDGRLPQIQADINIPKSYFKDERYSGGVRELIVDVNGKYNPLISDSIFVKINNLVVNGEGIKLKCNGLVNSILGCVEIDGYIKGDINLSRLNELYPQKDGSYAKGVVKADMNIKSSLKDYSLKEILMSDAKGQMIFDSVAFDLKKYGMYGWVRSANLNFGTMSNSRDSLIEIGTRMIGLRASADSMVYRQNDTYNLIIKGFSFAGHTSTTIVDGDSTVVSPLNMIVNADQLFFVGSDSVSVAMVNSKNRFSVLPKNNDYERVNMRVKSDNDIFAVKMADGRFSLRNCKFDFDTYRIRGFKESNRRRVERIDSLAKIYPGISRDSLISYYRSIRRNAESAAADEFDKANINFSLDRQIRRLIRNWSFDGNFYADGGRIRTPLFPLSNIVKKVDLSFNDNELLSKDFHLQIGESDLNMMGKVSNFKNMLLGRSKIDVDVELRSDTLNCNELIRAANEGMRYYAQNDYDKGDVRSMSDAEIDRYSTIRGADSLEKLDLIVVPSNLDLNIVADVQSGRYSNLELELFLCELYVKDRCIQLKNFMACTDAGELDLDAYYATVNKENISCGFDMEIKDIQAKRLISLIPSVDTLLPMIKSFEGLLNCGVAATVKIDTLMNFKTETLKGIAKLKGKNLVLLDGETFAEISKKLMFKNKKRNFIDSVSVNLLVNDNKIELFPFIMEMDRYRTAISGTQNLDMSFKYHISVLKSPVPFRLGVDIYGTPDNYKYRVGRAKYKNTRLPVYTGLVDTTRRNLRDYIINIYNRGINEALSNRESGKIIENLQKRSESMTKEAEISEVEEEVLEEKK